jgi:hypothetical protein
MNTGNDAFSRGTTCMQQQHRKPACDKHGMHARQILLASAEVFIVLQLPTYRPDIAAAGNLHTLSRARCGIARVKVKG